MVSFVIDVLLIYAAIIIVPKLFGSTPDTHRNIEEYISKFKE